MPNTYAWYICMATIYRYPYVDSRDFAPTVTTTACVHNMVITLQVALTGSLATSPSNCLQVSQLAAKLWHLLCYYVPGLPYYVWFALFL